jgi:tetratricopeptide (TPR) repeat protein
MAYTQCYACFKTVYGNNIFAYDAQKYSDEIIKLCEKNIKDINDIIKKQESNNNYAYFMLGYWYKITDKLDKAIINYNNLIMIYGEAAAYYCRHSFHYERGKRSCCGFVFKRENKIP